VHVSPESRAQYYKTLYESDLEAEAQWLRLGANDKATTVETLIRRNHVAPQSLLEIGSGTGAVILECQRRNIAREYTAIDYSNEAIAYLTAHSRGIQTRVADITRNELTSLGHFDVVLLSHVLEHLDDPGSVLRGLSDLDFDYLVAEVPLEDLPLYRLKSLITDYRRINIAGHVQFFTAESFDALLASYDFEIIDRRTYVPIPETTTIDFTCAKDGLGKLRKLQMLVTRRYLPLVMRRAWSKLYYGHYGVLCRRRSRTGTA
jgi:SAM-dependent methyltransferase